VQALRPMVGVDPQARCEPGGLPLPVPDQRHRAQQQRRADRGAVGAVGRLQGQQLHRLAQPHVVGQARPEPQRGQERQPRQPPLLVGTQDGLEMIRHRHRTQRLRNGSAEQLSQPAVGRDAGEGQRRAEVVRMAGGQPQDLGRGGLPGPFTGQELQAALELIGVDRYPLAPEPDEGGLGRGERGDLLLGQGVIADGELPAEVHELFPAEPAGLLHDAVGRGGR